MERAHGCPCHEYVNPCPYPPRPFDALEPRVAREGLLVTGGTRHAVGFTVGITTRNRAALLRRAIESALSQDLGQVELIIVDDASTDDTWSVANSYPEVRLLRHCEQKGPCAGRNWIIREATNRWVILLDDDDTLLPNALSAVQEAIQHYPDSYQYPVLQFARTNGRLSTCDFLVARFAHYMDGTLRGDFTPVIQRDLFLELGLAYPPIRVGGENLLWWGVADRFGIPTWATQIVRLGTEARLRLTSVEHQVRSAAEYARYQEMLLETYGATLRSSFRSVYHKKLLAAATYWLLAGDRKAARAHLAALVKDRGPVIAPLVWVASFAPQWLIRSLFIAYRRMTSL